MHLSPELQKQIPGASSGGITPRLIQVNSLAPPFHFHVKILNFHGQIIFLGRQNLGFSAHMDIGIFSMYGKPYTQKKS